MNKKSDWVFAMLNAVTILGHRAYGAHLGCLVWPHKVEYQSPHSRWRCGLGAAANTCARKLVKKGLLREMLHRDEAGELQFHFAVTSAGGIFILSQIRDGEEASHAN